jgi:hypothetical protein
MTTRRTFIAGGLAAAGLAITGGRAAGAPKPTITVHRSPT